MLKRFSPMPLAFAISWLMFQAPAGVYAQAGAGAPQAEKIKAEVAAIGAGARVSVKTRDKRKLTGYVNYVGEQDFVLTVGKGNDRRRIAYADVTSIERKENKSVSTGLKVALGVVGVLWLMGMIANGGG